MKNLSLIVSALLISIAGFSQGIRFENGTWAEVLAKAKQSNKPVFIDVYTSWCAPCKKMSNEVFPLAEVGKVYNANFICYQIDAEKGEGIEIAKKYDVKAYPTYLFVKADGVLFSRSMSSIDADAFIGISKKALMDLNDPKSLTEWEKEYILKRNDTVFLKKYIGKRMELGLSFATQFDNYLQLMPEKNRTSNYVANLYYELEKHLKIYSFAYSNLAKNINKFNVKYAKIIDQELEAGIMNTLGEAAESKDEQLLKNVMTTFDQLPQLPNLKDKEVLYMQYYEKTGEFEKCLQHGIDFCNNTIMKMSPDSIFKKDEMYLQMLEKRFVSGEMSQNEQDQIVALRKFMAHSERDKYSGYLAGIANMVFGSVSDVNTLQNALSWTARSLELKPNTPRIMDLYANLLYKLGRKTEAIAKESEALEIAKKTNADSKAYEETLRKMNSGEKTWK